MKVGTSDQFERRRFDFLPQITIHKEFCPPRGSWNEEEDESHENNTITSLWVDVFKRIGQVLGNAKQLVWLKVSTSYRLSIRANAQPNAGFANFPNKFPSKMKGLTETMVVLKSTFDVKYSSEIF